MLRLITFPVTVAGGKRLFGEGATPRTWRLESSAVSSTGAVMAEYRRAGELTTGDFTLPAAPGGSQ